MPRILAALVLLSALGSVVAPREAGATPTVSQLVEQLRTSEDFRVRTQAALALGASGDDAAVKPLCEGLSDANTVVKVAAAAALGKLGKPAAIPCLKAARVKESVLAVKAQEEKAIAKLEQLSGPAAPPPPGPDAKYYVAMVVTNKTSRPTAEVEALVRGAMQTRFLSKKGYAVAPKVESSAEGKKIVKSKKLKGFFLIVTVDPPVYGGGELTQRLSVSMWSYPDKALQGEFATKLAQTGTPKVDPESEALLMKMCAENAADTFQKVSASL